MDSRSLFQSAAGVHYTWHQDDSDPGRVLLESSIDVDPLIDHLAARRAAVDGTPMNDGMELAGSIPINIFYEIRDKYTDQFNKVDKAAFTVACLQWLQDNNKFLARTTMKLL